MTHTCTFDAILSCAFIRHELFALCHVSLSQELSLDDDGDPIDTALSCLGEENMELTEENAELRNRLQEMTQKLIETEVFATI